MNKLVTLSFVACTLTCNNMSGMLMRCVKQAAPRRTFTQQRHFQYTCTPPQTYTTPRKNIFNLDQYSNQPLTETDKHLNDLLLRNAVIKNYLKDQKNLFPLIEEMLKQQENLATQVIRGKKQLCFESLKAQETILQDLLKRNISSSTKTRDYADSLNTNPIGHANE